MKNKRLIVIEGFDRSGKDTLLQDLKKLNLSGSVFVYENDLSGLPSYSKEEDKFLEWLNLFIDKQTSDLLNLFKKYDTIIMVRLIVSDEVYSALFERERTTYKYMSKLKDVEINNYAILFYNYDEYLKRVKMIPSENEIQYSQDSFDEINQLYHDVLENIGYEYHINFIKSLTTKEEILKDFINIYNLN